MLNLTPHSITVVGADGTEKTFPPSGQVARVATVEAVIGFCPVTGAPVVSRTFGEVQGLPEDNTPCLVPSMVLSACPGRPETYAPDTGPTALRFQDGPQKGQVRAVTRLVAA